MKVQYHGLDITPLFPGLLYTGLFTLYIIVVRPSLPFLILTVLVINTAMYLYKPKPTLAEYAATQLITITTILAIYYAYYFFGGYGVISLISITYSIALLIVWRRWGMIKPMLQWWEKRYLGMTAEERHRRKKRV